MIKFFSKLRRRKGFTLTEMIVVTALVGIIMASVVAFADPIRKTVKDTEARADALTINEVLGKYVEHNLAYASRINAFVGYTYENSVADISKTFDDPMDDSGDYKASMSDPNTTVKLFVAHLDTSGEKGTMKFYDVKLTSSGLPSLATLESTDGALIYTDDFYAGYQYFMTIDDDFLEANTNARNKKAYMNLRLESYKCVETDIDDALVTGYYSWINHKGGLGTTNTFDPIAFEKLGTENISFTLENIKATEVSQIKTDTSGNKLYYSNGAPIWKTTTSSGGVHIDRADSGTDLVIIYKVKKY